MKNKTLIVICVLSGLLFFICCCTVGSILITNVKEKIAFDDLIKTVEQAGSDTTPIQKEPESSDSEQTTDAASNDKTCLPEYAELYKQNNDFFGWLSVEGTAINYPVMQTPQDPQYYLSHAFDKSSSTSGTPFLDGECTQDGDIYIIYGHHMSNGTMFASLPNYADEAYWENHKTINFDTLYEHGEYEVIAAFPSRIYTPEQKGFRYYEYTDLSSKVMFDAYMEQVMDSALYDTGVAAEYGDTLLVLSTCNYHIKDGRFVVVAKKK